MKIIQNSSQIKETQRKANQLHMWQLKKERTRQMRIIRKDFCKKHKRYPNLVEAVELLDATNEYTKESSSYFTALKSLCWAPLSEIRMMYKITFHPEELTTENSNENDEENASELEESVASFLDDL
jgi:hypothetical protein